MQFLMMPLRVQSISAFEWTPVSNSSGIFETAAKIKGAYVIFFNYYINKMAIFSKYIDLAMQKYDENGLSKTTISRVILCAAVCAYTFKTTYPLFGKQFVNKNNVEDAYKNNNRTSYMELNDHIVNTTVNEDSKLAEAEKLIIAKQLKQKSLHIEPGLNEEFVLQLRKLIKIIVPKVLCYESGLLIVHTLCLISRTFLSIYVAALEGAIVKFIVRKDLKRFVIVLLKWFGIAIPATFINSMIRFLESKLSLAFRTRLVRHSYRLYFKNQNYYRVSNLDGRIENADHRLTEDIAIFSTSVAHLYSSVTKPCFDLMLIGFALMRSTQKMKANIVSGPTLAIVVISLTAHIIRVVSPKFGQLVAEEANRYGYLRHIHSRIITNSEEIAFYGGHKVELQQLRQAYNRLVIQMNNIFIQKLWFVMLEQFFMKYVWSGTGMIMVSLPILMSGTSLQKKDVNDPISTEVLNSSVSERTQYLTTARNLLISAADAIERLMSSYKEIVALAGYTYRVAGMMQVFEETAQGVYHKNTVVENNEMNGIIEFKDGKPIAKGRIIYTDTPNDMTITLRAVPVVTPNCDIVVSSLTLCIEQGMHLLITGPNGCEDKPCMFYIPQRPYMSTGSLCDQIIYPDSREDMLRKGFTENQLRGILKMVCLEHIAQRDGFNAVRDWKDILSGGEKQRMAIARLFYHRPKYALLDECTSAVSIDVESTIYEIAKSMDITLLTITHRPTLWKFHTHILEFNGQGNWSFRQMEPNEQYLP
ncbi:ATP-binding cassette sub-family D member isoform X3 [Bactrocera neohumeralis]|uniref:ATP-binding cassette sub-family D member isoform X3 n=1 Tax=Bactrocera neohumeralis TaxID=98809 RepID=UPI002166ADC7|nr:ATP-binding cassette sub-family D member isoform X3 [Bactrocera neohumeralis]